MPEVLHQSAQEFLQVCQGAEGAVLDLGDMVTLQALWRIRGGGLDERELIYKNTTMHTKVRCCTYLGKY